jgi:hypothetical protein
MPRYEQLASLGVGDIAALPVRVTAKTAAGMTLAPLARDPTTGDLANQGTLTVDAAGAVTGAWTSDPRAQPMLVSVRQLAPGDLLLGADGMVVMVRAAGLGADGTWWSPYPDGHAPQPQEGFSFYRHEVPP